MNYIIIDKFTNSLVTDENGIILEFDSEINANIEATQHQNGLVIPLETDRLFTKIQVIDLLVAFDQCVNPESYSSSKEMDSSDFFDGAWGKASSLGLKEEFEKAQEIYANLDEDGISNYSIEDLL